MAKPATPRPWTYIEVAGVRFHYSYEDSSRTKLHIEQYGKTLVDAVRLWKLFTDQQLWSYNRLRKRFDGFTETELLSWDQGVDAGGMLNVWLYTCMNRSDSQLGG